MATRIIAQLLVAGGTVLARAVVQAYRQAIVNGQRAGVNAETLRAAAKGRQMTIEEARMILGVDANAPLEEVLKRYQHLFDVNEKSGSFYLQSKVYRAKEALEAELQNSKQAQTEDDPQ